MLLIKAPLSCFALLLGGIYIRVYSLYRKSEEGIRIILDTLIISTIGVDFNLQNNNGMFICMYVKFRRLDVE